VTLGPCKVGRSLLFSVGFEYDAYCNHVSENWKCFLLRKTAASMDKRAHASLLLQALTCGRCLGLSPCYLVSELVLREAMSRNIFKLHSKVLKLQGYWNYFLFESIEEPNASLLTRLNSPMNLKLNQRLRCLRVQDTG
jgi:hypothetical protein